MDAETKFVVHCIDALQGMYCCLIILTVSVSNDLLTVTVEFISLCCVC